MTEHLSYFMKRLQFSGYDKRFRYSIAKSALKRYDESKSKPKDIVQQKSKKRKWHQNTDTVLFVQATKDGELMKEI